MGSVDGGPRFEGQACAFAPLDPLRLCLVSTWARLVGVRCSRTLSSCPPAGEPGLLRLLPPLLALLGVCSRLTSGADP